MQIIAIFFAKNIFIGVFAAPKCHFKMFDFNLFNTQINHP